MARRILNAVIAVSGKVIAFALKGVIKQGLGNLGEFAGEVFADQIGEHVAKGLFGWIGGRPKPEAAVSIENFANLNDADLSLQLDSLIEEIGPGCSDHDSQIVRSYMIATRAEMRAGLARDPASGKSTCPVSQLPTTEAEVLRLLPATLPPFTTPHKLEGTPFTLVELAGSGAFGSVYRAVNDYEQHGEPRAIKFPAGSAALANLRQERDLLEKMIAAAGDRRHWPAGIVRLFGHKLDVERPFLIYEWVDGGDLAARVARLRAESGAGLPPETVLQILRNIATPLAAMHALDLVHQDLKPANCMLPDERTWDVKLTDFGIGAVADSPARMTTARVTQSQQRQMRGSGTPLYMSQEQKAGQRHTSNDIYSLGVMAYQLLLGDVARELPVAWRRELKKKLNTPDRLIDLIDACTGLLEDRPRDAAALLKQIDADGPTLSPPAAEPARAKPAPAPPAPTTPIAAPAKPAALAPALRPSPVEFINSLGAKFVPINSGTFMMGSPDGEEGREEGEILHNVTLTRPFYMAAHHVTRGQFAAFVNDSGCETQAETDGWGHGWTGDKWDKVNGASWRKPGFEQDDSHPVVTVTWNDAVAFAQWLSRKEGKTYRLPTEAEWEYACRAATSTPFNTGPTISTDQANYHGGYTCGAGNKGVWRKGTTPVGSFPANKWGLFDMHGNALQWCRDVYDEKYYDGGAMTDPTGPEQNPNASRVLRGGRGTSFRASAAVRTATGACPASGTTA